MTTVLRVGVLGPGGVGGLLAGSLARAGAPVTCIATESTAAILKTNGISVTSDRFGTFHQPVDAETILKAPIDVLCIAVKATTLIEALDRVPADVLGNAIVVPLLNGVEHLALLRKHLTLARVVAATIRIESSRPTAGEIVQRSPFATVDLAPRSTEQAAIAPFAGLLSKAGFDVHVRDDEKTILWEKLSFLAPLALLTTMYGASAGVIRTQHRDELEAVISEAAAVAQAEGVAIDETRILEQFDSVPETMQSSMQRDAAAGLPLEIEAIGGAIVRLAASNSIKVVEISRIVTQLRAVPANPQ